MKAFRYGFAGLASLGFVACGASFAPSDAPGRPCPEITSAEYDAFSKTGAAKAVATVGENGSITMKTGPGQARCASGNSAQGPCRRPNPLVIRYQYPGGETRHVRVPAETEYRFRDGGEPTTCEIVVADPAG